MNHKLETVKESKYGHKARVFVACDDGSRICIMCLGETIDGPLDRYGVTKKHGRCYHCEFEVVLKNS